MPWVAREELELLEGLEEREKVAGQERDDEHEEQLRVLGDFEKTSAGSEVGIHSHRRAGAISRQQNRMPMAAVSHNIESRG